MKIVIDISEEDYRKVQDGRASVSMMRKSIRNGIPLPKGHGDLIDRSLLLEDMERGYRFANELVALGFAESFIEHAPTIIEADKEGAEE